MTQHSKLPWTVEEDESSAVNGYPNIRAADDDLVVGSEGFYGSHDRNWADARFVVKAVNNYTKLVTALKYGACELERKGDHQGASVLREVLSQVGEY